MKPPASPPATRAERRRALLARHMPIYAACARGDLTPQEAADLLLARRRPVVRPWLVDLLVLLALAWALME